MTKKHTEKKREIKETAPSKAANLTLNKYALIAAFLNLILVGLGYLYTKHYKKALITFVAYIAAYIIIFYLATFLPILIWLGLPITLFFVYDAYKTGEKANAFLFSF